MLEHAKIDFSKMSAVKSLEAVLHPNQRRFEKSFLTVDCADEDASPTRKQPEFTFPHLFSDALSSPAYCDVTLSGTVLLYSHDHIHNICHTMQDFMNVLLILWMEGAARHSEQITFLNVDSLRLYNNNEDLINGFFEPYKKMFPAPLLRGLDFESKSVCIQRLLTQPIPPKVCQFFTP